MQKSTLAVSDGRRNNLRLLSATGRRHSPSTEFRDADVGKPYQARDGLTLI
jgi:hypothetical protein